MPTNETILRFDGAALQPCEAPDWYAAIMRDGDENGGDVPAVYSRNGVYLHQEFGRDMDSVEVYNAGTHGYVIEYYDSSQCLAVILIDDVAAYLEFRAKYLYAWAWLIAEMERIADTEDQAAREQQRKRV